MSRTLEITTCIGCKQGCSFCPQSALSIAYSKTPERPSMRYFTMANFEKCLSTVPKDCQIHFSGFVEPLQNSLAPQMILLAHQRGYTVHLYTTCMGLLAEGAQLIKLARPALIRVHAPDKVAMRIHDHAWLEYFEVFRSTGLEFTTMAMGEMTPMVAERMASHGITVELPSMLSRGGNLKNVESPDHKGGIRCAMERWTQNVLLPNGDVWGCCQDYSGTVQLGNLLRQPYSAIETAAGWWKVNMEMDATGSICSKCSWATPI